MGCVVFVIVGLFWLGYTLLDLVVSSLGSCGGDEACAFYRPFVSGSIIWRGIAVALMLILAYLGFRALNRDDDV
jgi:hypothetical protein